MPDSDWRQALMEAMSGQSPPAPPAPAPPMANPIPHEARPAQEAAFMQQMAELIAQATGGGRVIDGGYYSRPPGGRVR